MSFQWTDFLGLAEELCDRTGANPSRSAHARTAISRAYYAAYHAARDLLEARQQYNPPRDGGIHAYVVREYRDGSDRFYQKIGQDLERLLERRRRADYEIRAPEMTLETAKVETERAQKVVERIDKLSRGQKGS